MKKLIRIILMVCLFFASQFSFVDATNNISIFPTKPLQGDPLIVQIENIKLDEISKITLNGKSLWFFNYKNKPTFFWGIDLNEKAEDYDLVIKKENGEIINEKIQIFKREKYEAPLGIPAKLGGNTPQAGKQLVSNLTKENNELNSLTSLNKRMWSVNFSLPLLKNEVTDDYGYSRQTAGYTIAHKGTDFRAKEGTPIYAINSGIIKKAKTYEVYGKTVIIDHGLGVNSFYMHLSKIKVKVGDYVKKGQEIGLSGSTGYAESPHLHLSIKINNQSIDPYKFIEFFK
jgi:murein DD-endopeptidase MepM/ murein hydrolase activator NlpD